MRLVPTQPPADNLLARMPGGIEYLMTVDEVATFFRVSAQTVRLWIKEGKLKAYRTPHHDGLNKEIPANERRTTLYFSRQSLADWAEIYYKL